MKTNIIIVGACLLVLGCLAGCDDYKRKNIEHNATTNKPSLDIWVGETFQLTANPSELGFVWTSSDSDVASVDGSGLVTAKARGTAVITAQAGDVVCSVPVTSRVRIPLRDFRLDVSSLEMLIGVKREIKIYTEPIDANDMDVYWRSSNSKVVEVDQDNVLMTKGEGEAVVECIINGITRTVDVLASKSLPCKSHVLSAAVPCNIMAWNFDLGGEGAAYHDSDSRSEFGHGYRASIGDANCWVDVEGTAGNGADGDPRNIGEIHPDEWLVYTVNVQDAGDYLAYVQMSAGSAGSRYHIEVDDVDVTGSVTMPGSSGWTTWWHTLCPTPISLAAGRHKIKFYMETDGFNLRSLRFMLNDPRKDIYPMEFIGSPTRMTVTYGDNFTTLKATANDPFISSTQLGRPLSDGTKRVFLTFEYKNNQSTVDTQFFYAVNGGAQGSKSSAANIQMPQVSDWTRFEFDLSTAINSFGWGVNNSGGREPAEHFLRFDPIMNSTTYEISVKNVQVEIFLE
jgi:hypothetical protein